MCALHILACRYISISMLHRNYYRNRLGASASASTSTPHTRDLSLNLSCWKFIESVAWKLSIGKHVTQITIHPSVNWQKRQQQQQRQKKLPPQIWSVAFRYRWGSQNCENIFAQNLDPHRCVFLRNWGLSVYFSYWRGSNALHSLLPNLISTCFNKIKEK